MSVPCRRHDGTPQRATPARGTDGRVGVLGVTALLWAGMFVVVFALAVLFPPTGDDWSRIAFQNRTPAGFLDQAVGSYEGHNGRIVGNSLSFLLIEPVWVRAAAKAATVVGLVAALQRATRSEAPWAALAAFAGVFLLPAGLFRESYVWSAGFYNYVPPMVAVLLLVATLAGRRGQPQGARRGASLLGCAVLGFVACLFVEHVTVALLLLALGGVIAPVVQRRAVAPDVLGWAAGTVLGTTVLFASPGLREVARHEDAYFSYASSLGDLVGRAVVNYALVTESFVLSNPVLLALTAVALLAAAVLRRDGSTRAGWFVVAAVCVVVGWAVISRLGLRDGLRCAAATADSCSPAVLGVDLLVLALLLAAMVVAGSTSLLAAADRRVWLALLAATVLMLGPLLVVSPIGPRNLFGPTVTVAALAVLQFRAALGSSARPLVERAAALLVGACVVVVLAVFFVIQAANARAAAERVRIMERAVAERQTTVELPPFPFPSWVHDASDEKIGNRYYLQQARDIEIRFP